MTRQLPEAGRTGAAGPPGSARPGTGPADGRSAHAGPGETAWPPEGAGQVPFTLRIGVTGHRQLTDPAALVPAVRDAIQGVIERFLGAGAEPALLVISALAEGADRLVAAEVLAGPGATLEAVLPLPPGEYVDDFTGDASKAEFNHLLGQAATVWQARPGGSRDEAYERAGRHVVDRADVLIALWDGEPPRGRGGTATVVAYAREQGVPVAWVPTSGSGSPVYWYDHDRAARVEEAARDFRQYNAAAIPEFTARAYTERGRLEPAADHPLAPACGSVASWVIPYFVRADVLATRLERVFRLTNWTMFLAAAAAVVVVAVQVTVWPELNWIAAAEVVLLLLLVAAPLVSRRLRVLDRWISYRFLAERLRSIYFLALAGAGDRPARGGERERSAYLSDPTEVWIQRALEEIMARRPDVRLGPADAAPLRDYLSQRWIGAQIRYHENTARRQGAWDSRLFAATGVLFLITAIAAFLHLLGWGEHHGDPANVGLLLIVLSICVPAIGAAVHGIRTQSEFRRHCQRYERMAGLLRQLDADMSRAESITVIHEIAADAEQLMRAENSDWFGVMRFHDVELIT
ncbi:MAG: hypothetical protein QOG05_788 [Streptosporangiaceae bacterium]|nr:hypothetical protein [Streptosporangiaceae bacterium]